MGKAVADVPGEIRTGGWTQTYTGVKFYPFDVRPEDIRIEDIAHSLAMQCRFMGHCKHFYSVAQHSVYVSFLCGGSAGIPHISALWGLLHDASEAYLGDLVRPIKCMDSMAAYREAEDRIMAAVCERFRLPKEMPEEVKGADDHALYCEAVRLMPDASKWECFGRYEGTVVPKIIYTHPQEAERGFLRRYRQLTGSGPDV